ncbi:copper amine oxidase N-terminal domain-containing protein [Fodinisporobacter ferrooxydans]|uniref:Copper amine oxidase N-terminal domain-containing protein n=1 Tax=Fodinisporobacter ferrooxydans TaxID=2901836 RepID=A0ABY4CQN2_9BACL|nr:copper amine oxidase N-terminal domain-containing protein [Alicyclobacillaceae bacterium MYW30-H2]
MNKGKKLLAVVSTAAMLASLAPAAGFVATNAAYAAGNGSLSAITVPNVNSSNQTYNFGTVDIFIPKGTLLPGGDNQVTITLPSGLQFSDAVGSKTVSTTGTATGSTDSEIFYDASGNTTNVANDVYGYSPFNSTGATLTTTTQILSATTAKITVDPSAATTDDAHVYLKLSNLKNVGVASGPVQIGFSAASDSVLPAGTVTVANVVSSGQVDLAATDTQSSSDNFTFNLHLTEEVANSMRLSSDSLKLKLPNGFKWSTTAAGSIVNIFGDNARLVTTADTNPGFQVSVTGAGTDTLYVNAIGEYNSATQTYVGTQAASSWNIPLNFYVDDSSVAKTGDVVAQVNGSSTVNTGTLTVGTYGEYGGAVSASSKPSLVAGQKEQQISDIAIKENVAGSFVSNRTIELTLPNGVRWESPFENSTNIANGSYTGSISGTNGLTISKVEYTNTDHRTLKLTVQSSESSNSTNPGEIDLKNFQVAIAPNFSGDMALQVGGSEGLTGNVTVATVQKPVSISVASKPNVTIGAAGQQIGDITLTENVASAFNKTTVNGTTYNYVHLELPYGVQFSGTPDVQVTSGDLKIKDVTSGLGSNNKGYLDFYVDSSSTTPSTITIKAPQLSLDRTVPQGDISLKVKGNSVGYTAYAIDAGSNNNSYAVANWNSNDTTAASAVVATVATPAPTDTTSKAVFTIGNASYSVNGQTQTAVVAPFIKDSRTFVGVRDAANALGIDASHIVWNNADRTVTIFNGNRIVQMKIGSYQMIINGATISMDTAPAIVNDYTVLPVSWIAQALGVNVSWDAATQTATFGN